MRYNVGDIVKIKDSLRYGQSTYAPYSNYYNAVCGNELTVSGKTVKITGCTARGEVFVTYNNAEILIWESVIERKVM